MKRTGEAKASRGLMLASAFVFTAIKLSVLLFFCLGLFLIPFELIPSTSRTGVRPQGLPAEGLAETSQGPQIIPAYFERMEDAGSRDSSRTI